MPLQLYEMIFLCHEARDAGGEGKKKPRKRRAKDAVAAVFGDATSSPHLTLVVVIERKHPYHSLGLSGRPTMECGCDVFQASSLPCGSPAKPLVRSFGMTPETSPFRILAWPDPNCDRCLTTAGFEGQRRHCKPCGVHEGLLEIWVLRLAAFVADLSKVHANREASTKILI